MTDAVTHVADETFTLSNVENTMKVTVEAANIGGELALIHSLVEDARDAATAASEDAADAAQSAEDAANAAASAGGTNLRTINFLTIGELRGHNMPPASSPTIANVAAHTTIGFKGGGTFVIDTAETGPDDNGLTIVDALGRRWKRQVNGYVTKEMFGGNAQQAADAAWGRRLPFYHDTITTPIVTVSLNITDGNTVGMTSAARGDLLREFMDWGMRCMTTANAPLNQKLTGEGAITVSGQYHVGHFGLDNNLELGYGGSTFRQLRLRMETPQFVAIDTAANPAVAYGSKSGVVSYVSLPFDNSDLPQYPGGAPAVTFVGGTHAAGSPTPPSATCYLDANNRPKSIVVGAKGGNYDYPTQPDVYLNGVNMTQWLTPPGAAPGVPNTASIFAVMNHDVKMVTIKLATWPSTTSGKVGAIAGQPCSFSEVRGTNGCNIAGASYIILPDEAAKTIRVVWTDPSVIGQSSGVLEGYSGGAKTGTVVLPRNWIDVDGGYDGAANGSNGFLNANHRGVLQLEYFFVRWKDSQYAQRKTEMSGLHNENGGLVMINNYTIFCNFPERQVRGGGSFFINRLHAGGGYNGLHGALFQLEGTINATSMAIGGVKGTVLGIDGVSFIMSNSEISSGVNGIDVSSGEATLANTRISGCREGLRTRYGAFASGISNEFFRNDIGIVPFQGGIYCAPSTGASVDVFGGDAGTPAGTENTQNVEGDVPLDTLLYGGGYISTANTEVIYRGIKFYARNTDAGAADWDGVLLDRASGSPSVNDILSSIAFRGRNASVLEDVNYARLRGEIVATGNGVEAGRLRFLTMVAGVETAILTAQSGIQIGTPAGGDKGAGTLNVQGEIYKAGVAIGGGGDIPTGTRMLFQQATAPTGWTKDTAAAMSDKALRLTTGASVPGGGSVPFTTVFVGGSTDPFTLLTANMPAHNHMLDTVLTPSGTADAALNRTITGTPSIATHAADMQNTGGGTAHSHGLPALAYVDIIVATKA